MIHLFLPYALASVLAGAGMYGILSRRNAVLMLVGVELVLAAANLILVTVSATSGDKLASGQILSIFIMTLAAAEVAVALGVILVAFRTNGHIDLTAKPLDDGTVPATASGASERTGAGPASGSSAAPKTDTTDVNNTAETEQEVTS